jgi:WD40 repeat protein
VSARNCFILTLNEPDWEEISLCKSVKVPALEVWVQMHAFAHAYPVCCYVAMLTVAYGNNASDLLAAVLQEFQVYAMRKMETKKEKLVAEVEKIGKKLAETHNAAMAKLTNVHSCWGKSYEDSFRRSDRPRVVVGVGTTAQVWDFETERLIGRALRHEKEIVAASFSPDGRLVVTASWDETARLWDAGTGRMITDPLRHGAELHLALFSPDGRRTVTADTVGAVRIWDVERGTLVVGPIRHPQPSGFTASVGVAFDQEGRRVATVEREGSIQLWDAQTGQPS